MDNKKELIKRYKQTVQDMGIFQIKNKTNGKIFIGSAKDLPGIMNSNKFQLKIGRHYNQVLQKEYSDSGETNFDFEVLDYLKPKEDPLYDYSEDLKVLEEMWLEKLQPYGDKGYNRLKK
jgi:hypothetical protein